MLVKSTNMSCSVRLNTCGTCVTVVISSVNLHSKSHKRSANFLIIWPRQCGPMIVDFAKML